ncbi:MAG TPA: hypothetical protein VFJ06_01875 [Halococcus sp.]|nr:hypothetical protein [Halococcus sp.]
MNQPDEQRRERADEHAADICRNGVEACAGPAAFYLSSEFHVPICRDCAREAHGL